MAETVGTIQVVATINTSNYDANKKKIESGNNDLANSAEKSSKSFSAAWTGAIAGAAAAIVNKGINLISNSLDSAITRVDTLNNANRTFANMSISTEDSAKAVKLLSKSIEGLPTTLDDAISGVTSLTATYGDIDTGRKVFTALNDAILGFGGSSEMVNNAITQLSQLPLDGPLDAQTWNSLRNSGITPVLTAMAKDSGMSVSAMKTAFGDGTLTVQDFIDRLVKMDTEGSSSLASLQKIANDSTSGISTGFTNMKTAITKGVADIIMAIGSENISSFIKNVGVGFKSVLDNIADFVKWMQKAGAAQDIIKGIAAAIISLGIAVIAYNKYIKIAKIVTVAFATASEFLSLVMSLQAQGLGVVRAAWEALNITMKANLIGIIITAIVALVAALVWFFTQTKTGQKIWADFTSFITSAITSIGSFFSTVFGAIKTTVKNVFNWIKTNWPLLFAIITGPIGLAVYAIIKNFKTIKSVIGNVWSWIIGVFSTIGKIAANIIKTPVNAILGFAENVINGFIRSINGVIKIINKLPGVNIGVIGTLNIPKLADGGIVSSPTLAMIGEGSESEAVIPLSELDNMINGSKSDQPVQINISMSGIMSSTPADERAIAKRLISRFNEELKSKNITQIGIA